MSDGIVSVIVPYFNCAAYLGEAIESVLMQTYPHVELVLVDDGSTDASAEVAARYRDRARLVRQRNAGVGPARNAGMDATGGEFIAFLDADDLWEPTKLERQVAVLAAGPAVDAVTAMVREFLSPELDAATAPLAPAPEPRTGAIPSALLLRRSAAERVGPFIASQTGHWADWWSRLLDAGLGTEGVPEVLVHRRLHLTNLGYRHRADRAGYLLALKASLDRRREASG